MPGSVVCEETCLKGDITIASGCIVHTSASIIAEAGPIIIGENCIVEEYAKIIYKSKPGDDSVDRPATLIIGSNNVFEVGCTVEAIKIGERNIFECKSYVSSDVQISNGCVIGAGCRVTGKHILPENTIIFDGEKCNQREALEKQGSQIVQLDFLRRVLPNYHRIRKATYDPKKLREQI